MAEHDDELDYDQATAAGVDGTGRDGDPRFPHRLSTLTDAERARLSYAVTDPLSTLSQEERALLNPAPYCGHPKYADGHCAEMICANYHSRCFRHSASGDTSARCSLAVI